MERTWASLRHRKAPSDPDAGAMTRWSSSSNAKKHCRRTSCTIRDSTGKELDSLAYISYIQVSNGMSADDAEANVSQIVLMSPTTVRRWVTLWESTGEEALQGSRLC